MAPRRTFEPVKDWHDMDVEELEEELETYQQIGMEPPAHQLALMQQRIKELKTLRLIGGDI